MTILATVTPASFSLLHPQSVNAQQVSRGNGYVSIQLPSTGNQNDNWSCGPNSAARVLAFYGRNVDYNTVRSAVNQEFMLPPSVNVPAPRLTDPFRTRRVDIRTGTTPHVLRDVMKRWEGENVKLERKADFATLKRVLNEGKPVVALVRVGSIDTVVSGTWPEMHWISVTGFNEQKREIYYTDTDGGNYYYTYDEFLGKWDWRVGTGFASEALYKNGVQSRTMIWVDRTPSSLASSPSSQNQANAQLSPNVFNADYYLATYSDLRNAFGTDRVRAETHWLSRGILEGRQGTADFSPKCYLDRYRDLQNAFGSTNYTRALIHYLNNGITEGRNGRC
ncbi:C39 family peptidase [Prochlorothrix hollandica]|uniref:C39 family peptidase n=1 Tax=Prochlorothrix hollandica TaxID=1223 RepID=UPI0013755B28|nr:C39 family peptidase [Prochlorothrix hollandica]